MELKKMYHGRRFTLLPIPFRMLGMEPRDCTLEYMNHEEGWITRKDCEEKGGDYLKENCASDTYVSICLPKQVPWTTEAPATKALVASVVNPSDQA